MNRIGLGGGCHWCTEAVFRYLKGTDKVEQGWIGSLGEEKSLSEGVVVGFRPLEITLRDLLLVHLETHSSQSSHALRHRYRSAVYTFSESDYGSARCILEEYRAGEFPGLVTRVLPFRTFRRSPEQNRDYYFKNPRKPFCLRHVEPKLRYLEQHHGELVDPDARAARSVGLLPAGYGEVEHGGRRYGMSKTIHGEGRSCKVFARELGGNDVISFNFYRTRRGAVLKPCEMSSEKVLNFLRSVIVSVGIPSQENSG